jgi:hypothetical protein
LQRIENSRVISLPKMCKAATICDRRWAKSVHG